MALLRQARGLSHKPNQAPLRLRIHDLAAARMGAEERLVMVGSPQRCCLDNITLETCRRPWLALMGLQPLRGFAFIRALAAPVPTLPYVLLP